MTTKGSPRKDYSGKDTQANFAEMESEDNEQDSTAGSDADLEPYESQDEKPDPIKSVISNASTTTKTKKKDEGHKVASVDSVFKTSGRSKSLTCPKSVSVSVSTFPLYVFFGWGPSVGLGK